MTDYQYLARQSLVEIKGKIDVNTTTTNEFDRSTIFSLVLLGIFLGIVLYYLAEVVNKYLLQNQNNNKMTISNVINNLKEEIEKIENDSTKQDKPAMFLLNSSTIELKTTVNRSGKLEVAKMPFLESGLSLASSKDNIQTLSFNITPIRVFSGRKAQLIYKFKSKQQEEKPIDITIADWDTIGEKQYLWFVTIDKQSKWIDIDLLENFEIRENSEELSD